MSGVAPVKVKTAMLLEGPHWDDPDNLTPRKIGIEYEPRALPFVRAMIMNFLDMGLAWTPGERESVRGGMIIHSSILSDDAYGPLTSVIEYHPRALKMLRAAHLVLHAEDLARSHDIA